MAENQPPSATEGQGQFVERQAGPDALNRPDPDYPVEAYGILMSQESMSGPLPSPKLVAEYNEVIANGAERIMVMAEKEQAARLKENKSIQQLNKRMLKGHNFRGAFSQISATVLVLVMLGLGLYLAMNGQAELAKEIFRYTIIGVVSIFLGSQATKVLSGKKEEKAPGEE